MSKQRIAVIESPEYAAEVARLAADPRIIDMAWSIPADMADGFDPESWDDMRRASDEAHRRGVEADSIGGPAKAIRRVLDGLREAGLS